MKTRSASSFTSLGLALALALSAATSHATGLANPGFEAGDGNQVSDWTCFGNARQATNHARSGAYSLKLFGNWSGPWNASGVYQTLPARPGQRWTLSGYGLNASDDLLAGQNYALMKIVWWSGPHGTGEMLQPLSGTGALSGENPGIESAMLTNDTPTDSWQFLAASGVAPPGTMSVQLLGGLFLQPNNESGAAWFDDLKASVMPVWGHALSFDGVNDYLEFERLVSNDFTLECWFRSTQMAGEVGQWWQGMGLIDGEASGVTADFGLSLGAGKVLFGTGGTYDVTLHSEVVADGQWHHVAATREQATGAMKLYVDGQLVDSGTGGTDSLTAPPQLRVGSLATGVNFFEGELDDIRIWDKARTEAEISQSMVYPLTGAEANLVGYAKCDEGAGATVQDMVHEVQVPLQNGVQWTPSTIPLWGNALVFDGADDYIMVSNFGNAVPTSEVTVEFWQRLAVTDRIHRVFALSPDNSANRFLFEDRGDSLLWDFGDIANGGRLWSTNSLTVAGAWQHIALVAKAGTSPYMAIYCNGVLRAWTNRADAFAPYTADLFMGYRTDVRLYGELDEFRIWNKARTQAEIARDMRHPLTGNEPNLVTYWSCDDASTSVVHDATLNHYDGNLINGTTLVSSIISAPNLAANPGFEQGPGGWWPFGSTTLRNSSLWPHAGTNCVWVTNRTESWQGLEQQFQDVLQPGLDYLISGWARLDTAASQPVGMSILKTDSGSGTTYPQIAAGTATSSAWTRLMGSYTPTVSGTLTSLWLYMAGPAAGVNFYADDFIVAPDMAYAPVVLAATTLPASGLLNSNATLNGSVQPGGLPTTVWFEWRTNLVYNHAPAPIAAGSGWEELSVSNTLSGLTPGLLYHYRLVASNLLGVAYGAYHLFRLPEYWSPVLSLDGSSAITNECHAAFVDPGSIVTASPLAIAAGDYHALALKPDGSVVGWGLNSYGQTTITDSATNGVVAIAAGNLHSLALKADGSVVGWGNNDFGQTTIPASATNGVVAIAADGGFDSGFSLALRADGTVVGWGDNSWGQANGVLAGSNVVAIAAGGTHSLALKADGTGVGWGGNSWGQTNGASAGSNVVAIEAGSLHSLALKADGTVVGWGCNNWGQANGALAGNNVVAIAAGGTHGLALRADGSVVGWGYNDFGQANGALAGSNVVAIAAGGTHSLALKADGSIVGWGVNDFGLTTIPDGLNTLKLPVAVSGMVDTNTPGSYKLTYGVTNSLGAVATATRTVVVADTLPPVLTLLGENPLMLELDAPFTDPGATASDQCGGDLTTEIVFANSVNPNLAGAYTNTFTVTDASSNLAATNRLVLVVTRPVITGMEQLAGGFFQFTFTNTPGAQFDVLTTTNLSLPASEWTVLGPAYEYPPGRFQFMDVTTTNLPQRFYRLRWP